VWREGLADRHSENVLGVELPEQTRQAIDDYIRVANKRYSPLEALPV
jgi:hypothetical protein